MANGARRRHPRGDDPPEQSVDVAVLAQVIRMDVVRYEAPIP